MHALPKYAYASSAVIEIKGVISFQMVGDVLP